MERSSKIRLGFVPLNDAAPLLVARALQFFDAEGLDVELSREASWATVRDKLAAGLLDGAHILAPLALAMSVGLDCDQTPMAACFTLNFGGAAVTMAARFEQLTIDNRGANVLAKIVADRRAEHLNPLTFASVFPFSLHHYLLRDWLAFTGVDPDQDVRLTVAAPSRTAELLAGGLIEGFCAGEPWNEVAASKGVGRVIFRAQDLYPNAPDKVFATTQAWTTSHPELLASLIRALAKATAWIANAKNTGDLVSILSQGDAIGVEPSLIATSLAGIVFDGPGVNRPDVSHGVWLVRQMQRWNQLDHAFDPLSLAAKVYLPALYDQAMSG